MTTYEAARPWTAALYPIGAALIVAPVVQLAAAHTPLQPDLEGWRFSATQVLFSLLPTIILGAFTCMGTAALLGQRAALRALGLAALIAVPIGLALLGDFVLSFLQLRADVAKEHQAAFTNAAIRALVLGILSTLTALALGVSALRSSRRRGFTRDGDVRLVVGR